MNYDFQHHPPKDEATVKLHENVRTELDTVWTYLEAILPDGRPREKALVKTKLEEAMFWANAAIARA